MRRFPAASTLRTTARMSQGARNCPFFRLTARPVAGRGLDQVGLARQQSRYLEHIHDLRTGPGLRRFVHVGQHRQAGVGFDLLQDPQTRLQTRSAIGVMAGAVGFIERGLEYQRNPRFAARLRPICRRGAGTPRGFRSRRDRQSGPAAAPQTAPDRRRTAATVTKPTSTHGLWSAPARFRPGARARPESSRGTTDGSPKAGSAIPDGTGSPETTCGP